MNEYMGGRRGGLLFLHVVFGTHSLKTKTFALMFSHIYYKERDKISGPLVKMRGFLMAHTWDPRLSS